MKKISKVGIFLSVSILLLAVYGQLFINSAPFQFLNTQSLSSEEDGFHFVALPSTHDKDKFVPIDATEVRAEEEEEEEEDDKALALKKNLKHRSGLTSLFFDQAPALLFQTQEANNEFSFQYDFSPYSSNHRYLALEVFRL